MSQPPVLGFDEENTGVRQLSSMDYDSTSDVFLALSFGIIFAFVAGCGWWNAESSSSSRHRGRQHRDDSHDGDKGRGATLISPWVHKAVRTLALLILGVGVVLTVWGSFVRVDCVRKGHQQGAINGLACILFGVTAILSTYPALAYFWRRDVRKNTLVLAVYFLIIPGWILLATSIRQESIYAPYESTPMQITNSRAQYDANLSCNNLFHGSSSCQGLRGQIELFWESGACPGDVARPDDDDMDDDHQQRTFSSCRTWVSDPACDRIVYDSNGNLVQDETRAREDVVECMNERYDLPSFGGTYESGESDEDYLLHGGSSSSSNLTIIDAYGSCSPFLCEAVLDTSEDLVATMKPVGIAMSAAGAGVLLLVIFLEAWAGGSPPSTHTTKKVALKVKDDSDRGRGENCEDDEDPTTYQVPPSSMIIKLEHERIREEEEGSDSSSSGEEGDPPLRLHQTLWWSE